MNWSANTGNAKRGRVLLHATNVNGLGATQVVLSLLAAIEALGFQNRCVLALPTDGPIGGQQWINWPHVVRYRRPIGRSLSRVAECLLPRLALPNCDATFVLGDIPLRGLANQAVLFHSLHLIPPTVNQLSHDDTRLRVSRWMFSRNQSSIGTLFVQSEVVADEVRTAWPALASRIQVLPQPPPAWAVSRARSWKPRDRRRGLKLFFPAWGYEHKNHRLISDMGHSAPADRPAVLQSITVTVADTDPAIALPYAPWVHNVGRIGIEQCAVHYLESDALFFPSVRESLGLPLVEAMVLGLPVVCADMPFSRWLCGNEALYFDPRSPESAWDALRGLDQRLSRGWLPKWQTALEKLPVDWTTAVSRYFAAIDGMLGQALSLEPKAP